MDIKLYRTVAGAIVEQDHTRVLVHDADWDVLLNRLEPRKTLESLIDGLDPVDAPNTSELLPPIGSQQIWCAGVTYFRSRSARMTESEETGGADFYDRVYNAERPELFFKASPHQVVGSGGQVRIRGDSSWNVPEPELAVVLNSAGSIVGYTIGNDMSSRDIEGENPLYLPQAKVYDQACALGPCILIPDHPLPSDTVIDMAIERGSETVFAGTTKLDQLKRSPEELTEYLYRETSFPHGCVLLTGTGIIPDDDFTLQSGDHIRITIAAIGILENTVQ